MKFNLLSGIAIALSITLSPLQAGSDYNLVAEAVELLISQTHKNENMIVDLREEIKDLRSDNKKLSTSNELASENSKRMQAALLKLENKKPAVKKTGCDCNKINALEKKHDKEFGTLSLKVDILEKKQLVREEKDIAAIVGGDVVMSDSNAVEVAPKKVEETDAKMQEQKKRLENYIQSRKEHTAPSSK